MSTSKQLIHHRNVSTALKPQAKLLETNRRGRTSRLSLMERELCDVHVELAEDKKPDLFVSKSHSALSGFTELSSRSDLTGKAYWDQIFKEVEHSVHCEAKPKIPLIDYSMVLPHVLRKRINHIQDYEFSHSDDNVYIRDELRVERPQDFVSASDTDSDWMRSEQRFIIKRKKVEEHFSESQHSDIVRMDQEFEKFDLKVDEPVGHTEQKIDRTTWLAKFVCESRLNRICWDSRIERVLSSHKPRLLDEEAENLMDASAHRFIEWINSIGTEDMGMTPDKVKNLFSIQGDRTLLASIRTDPMEVNAIAKTVADKWNQPNMAIELKYEKLIRDHASRVNKEPIISAFGRTVPMCDRPWKKRPTDKIIQTVYPRELLTREKLFKGITHLRSTGALVNFYLNNPSLPRPEYLREIGDFERARQSPSKLDIPLYEQLGLRY